MLALVGLCAAFAVIGLILGYSSVRFKVEGNPLVEKIDALLPQTQCAQCNFPGCRPYAEAIAQGNAEINQCPPGGDETVKALADLLGVETKPLNAQSLPAVTRQVAVIDELACIGCTLCIQACPVDAILGAPKWMHTIIAAECTGCVLCIAPCPVDCISMQPMQETQAGWTWPEPTRRPK